MAHTETNTPTPLYIADNIRDAVLVIDLILQAGCVDEISADMLNGLIDPLIEGANYVERRMDGGAA